MRLWSKAIEWISLRLGGPERARVISILALVLGLDGADLGAVGSMSPILEHYFHINKAQVGILISASKGVGIFSTLFFGSIVDRLNRARLLAWIVVLWGVAMALCGAVPSFMILLIGRIALGIVAAATLPCVASLIGDYFPGRERGRIYSYVLSGEMIGTGVGFMICGELAQLSWRLGFWALVIPSIFLAWFVHKLPEPERGGNGALPGKKGQKSDPGERLIDKKLKEAGVQPRARLVLEQDPAKKTIWWAGKFVLSIPTNAVLVVSSALGYAFFAAVRTFGIQYAQSGYHLKHTSAVGMLGILGIGALAGVAVGGRMGDGLLSNGKLKARVWLPAIFFWVSVFLFFFGFYFQVLWLSVGLFALSAFALGAVNPPLDAARLDIIHPKLWGRAEAVRTIFRDIGEAVSPIAFGWLAQSLAPDAAGLRYAFLIMLIPLAIAGALSLITFRTYLPDAAAAIAYRDKTTEKR